MSDHSVRFERQHINEVERFKYLGLVVQDKG